MLRLPMFPLETVLFPHQLLPLHVFEERYRIMVRHCLEGDRRFGVVLIERGAEVGGGDTRTDVGTVAEIVRAGHLPDDRWLIEAVGRARCRVERWLADDPHPWAEVEVLDDPPSTGLDTQRWQEVEQRLRRVLALRSELGDAAPPSTTPLDSDPTLGAYQASVIAGFGPLDRLHLLEAGATTDRLGLLAELLEQLEADLRARLQAP